MTGEDNYARDHAASILADMIDERLGSDASDLSIEIQYVYVPEGDHPTPATASILVTLQHFVLMVQMVFPVSGGDDDMTAEISGLCLQHRISRGRLTAPANIERERASLRSTVITLLRERFEDYFQSPGGLRQLQLDHVRS